MNRILITLCLFFIYNDASDQLPDFLKACNRNDIDADNCFNDDMNDIWHQLGTGNEELGIPKATPSFPLNQDLNLNYEPITLSLRNINFYYLETIKVTNASINFKNHTIEFTYGNDLIMWKGKYRAQLNNETNPKAVEGEDGNIYWRNGQYHAIFNFDIVERNGKQYLNITNCTIGFDVEPNFDFENLNNDSNPEMRAAWENAKNNFVNDGVRQPCEQFVMSLYNNVFNKVPLNELFPDDENQDND